MVYKFGLIGHPIEHSLSPWIHSEFLKLAGLDGEYILYEGESASSSKCNKAVKRTSN
ncbi:hypothetical protein JCM21714_3214 [Gracilibacillus boraciitolerans JCM 21714]|uniref:Shikimate dehydrogenase substrate binding N-terminal domain-containing protein n=1 Tax=Gracilibacillus boraciitolerans JCM 21714 TaxID=1298598 RepID=W4VLJ9_9BACI|nr:hypothetical protein [Gracilibacillus boraciitolerans]GAE94082.1 hypothetical protein JCM21714_3214 [Gracilibacillus boraciitolerans JCM 21714]